MIAVGDIVRFTGHYTFCGIERHGILGRVIGVYAYPPEVHEPLADVAPFDGYYAGSDEPAWGCYGAAAGAGTRTGSAARGAAAAPLMLVTGASGGATVVA